MNLVEDFKAELQEIKDSLTQKADSSRPTKSVTAQETLNGRLSENTSDIKITDFDMDDKWSWGNLYISTLKKYTGINRQHGGIGYKYIIRMLVQHGLDVSLEGNTLTISADGITKKVSIESFFVDDMKKAIIEEMPESTYSQKQVTESLRAKGYNVILDKDGKIMFTGEDVANKEGDTVGYSDIWHVYRHGIKPKYNGTYGSGGYTYAECLADMCLNVGKEDDNASYKALLDCIKGFYNYLNYDCIVSLKGNKYSIELSVDGTQLIFTADDTEAKERWARLYPDKPYIGKERDYVFDLDPDFAKYLRDNIKQLSL